MELAGLVFSIFLATVVALGVVGLAVEELEEMDVVEAVSVYRDVVAATEEFIERHDSELIDCLVDDAATWTAGGERSAFMAVPVFTAPVHEDADRGQLQAALAFGRNYSNGCISGRNYDDGTGLAPGRVTPPSLSELGMLSVRLSDRAYPQTGGVLDASVGGQEHRDGDHRLGKRQLEYRVAVRAVNARRPGSGDPSPRVVLQAVVVLSGASGQLPGALVQRMVARGGFGGMLETHDRPGMDGRQAPGHRGIVGAGWRLDVCGGARFADVLGMSPAAAVPCFGGTLVTVGGRQLYQSPLDEIDLSYESRGLDGTGTTPAAVDEVDARQLFGDGATLAGAATGSLDPVDARWVTVVSAEAEIDPHEDEDRRMLWRAPGVPPRDELMHTMETDLDMGGHGIQNAAWVAGVLDPAGEVVAGVQLVSPVDSTGAQLPAADRGFPTAVVGDLLVTGDVYFGVPAHPDGTDPVVRGVVRSVGTEVADYGLAATGAAEPLDLAVFGRPGQRLGLARVEVGVTPGHGGDPLQTPPFPASTTGASVRLAAAANVDVASRCALRADGPSGRVRPAACVDAGSAPAAVGERGEWRVVSRGDIAVGAVEVFPLGVDVNADEVDWIGAQEVEMAAGDLAAATGVARIGVLDAALPRPAATARFRSDGDVVSLQGLDVALAGANALGAGIHGVTTGVTLDAAGFVDPMPGAAAAVPGIRWRGAGAIDVEPGTPGELTLDAARTRLRGVQPLELLGSDQGIYRGRTLEDALGRFTLGHADDSAWGQENRSWGAVDVVLPTACPAGLPGNRQYVVEAPYAHYATQVEVLDLYPVVGEILRTGLPENLNYRIEEVVVPEYPVGWGGVGGTSFAAHVATLSRNLPSGAAAVVFQDAHALSVCDWVGVSAAGLPPIDVSGRLLIEGRLPW